MYLVLEPNATVCVCARASVWCISPYKRGILCTLGGCPIIQLNYYIIYSEIASHFTVEGLSPTRRSPLQIPVTVLGCTSDPPASNWRFQCPLPTQDANFKSKLSPIPIIPSWCSINFLEHSQNGKNNFTY